MMVFVIACFLDCLNFIIMGRSVNNCGEGG